MDGRAPVGAVRRASAPGGRTTLDAVIAADPARELGAECAARFGGRLPFLLKVLAAEKALSIQVHPSREQAEAGYRAENRARARAGRQVAQLRRRLAQAGDPLRAHPVRGAGRACGPRRTPPRCCGALRVRELDAARRGPGGRGRRAGRGGRGGDDAALTAALGAILTWPAAGRAALVAAVAAGCERVAAGDGEYAAAAAATVRIAGDHPGDLGIVASLLLRHAGAAARRGGLPAGRRPALLPARHRRRTARQLRQRGAGRAHPQAHRRARAAQAHRPGGGRPGHRAAAARRRGARLRLARAGVPAVPGRARRRRR